MPYKVDDLLATGGTVGCVASILKSRNKTITGLNVVIELSDLKGRSKLNFPVFGSLVRLTYRQRRRGGSRWGHRAMEPWQRRSRRNLARSPGPPLK